MPMNTAEREAAVKRSKARKQPRIDAQEARRQKNIAALGDAYNPRATMTGQRMRWVQDGKKRTLMRVPVQVSMPPSRQLERRLFDAA